MRSLFGTAFLVGTVAIVGLAQVSTLVAQDPIAHDLLFVCVQDEASVAVLDMSTLEVVTRIRLTELGFGAQAAPHDVVVSNDGSAWYVSLVGEHRVLRFDSENRLVASTSMETPGMVALDPTGDLLAVSRSMSSTNPPRLLGLARASDLELDELDVVLPRPHALAISDDGRFVYTASLGTNQLVSIEVESLRREIIDVPGPPHAFVQLAISPDGRTLVASGELSGELSVFDLDDPARPRYLTSVALGPRPFDPVFAPDGRTVWVPVKGADEVAVVNVDEWIVSDRISGGGLRRPHSIEFSPDGGRVFVSNNGEPGASAPGSASEVTTLAHVVVIGTETHAIEAAVAIGRNLNGMGRRRPR